LGQQKERIAEQIIGSNRFGQKGSDRFVQHVGHVSMISCSVSVVISVRSVREHLLKKNFAAQLDDHKVRTSLKKQTIKQKPMSAVPYRIVPPNVMDHVLAYFDRIDGVPRGHFSAPKKR
jgi:hypothetical protein